MQTNNAEPISHLGSCLCGAVAFAVRAPLPGPDACHCKQCRKFSGHFFASADVPRNALTIEKGAKLITWYYSSERVRRGFCSICGSSLFWDAIQKDKIAIAMGAFDSPTQTMLALHIFVAEKGDYYHISDPLPQNMH